MVDSDDIFLTTVTDRLAALPDVQAVSLGGSRTQACAQPDADWDFAIYYRNSFDPDHLRAVGWPGEVSDLGGWGGGIFNGGAWLTIDDRKVDVHYRDLTVIDRELTKAAAGTVTIEPLQFHLAGVPTYIVLAEIALGRCLHGELPMVDYPVALRQAAFATWRDRAEATFDYASGNASRPERRPQVLGLLAQAVTFTAHAVAASQGQWVTNEKRLLAQVGLTNLAALFIHTEDLPRLSQAVAGLSRAALARAEKPVV